MTEKKWWPVLALTLLVVASAFPFYWAILASFTPEARLFQGPSLIPGHLVLDHYRALFTQRNFWVPIRNSLIVAGSTTAFCVGVGSLCAYALARLQFRGKLALSLLMLAPLVIPGVILGISILAFASRLAQFADDLWGLELDFLRPGLPLVVIGQFSYIVSIATLTIAARLKRFDTTLEDAAFNLGASRAAVLWTVTLPYLRPALVGAAAISFLMSFENFNTTLMLVGSDPPLTVMMYGRMREGASPVLNAVSLFLMVASALIALALLRRPARETARSPGLP